MPAYVPDNFDIGVQAPADSRVVKTTTVARDAIPSGVRFDGLAVYVVQDNITYQLQTGITNSDWVEIAGGSTGAEYLYNLLDVNVAVADDGYVLRYNNSTSKWDSRLGHFLEDVVSTSIKTNPTVTEVSTIGN